MGFINIDQVIDYAIRLEERAANLFIDLARNPIRPEVIPALKAMARMEVEHKVRLLKIREIGASLPEEERMLDFQLLEEFPEVEIDPDLDFRGVRAMAIENEEEAHRIYLELAHQATDPEIRAAFAALAAEEMDHKRMLEELG